MREKIEIPAFRDKDMRKILDHFGKLDGMEKAELSCQYCSLTLTWNNLGAMLVRGEGLLLYCNLSECLEEASKGGDDG